jgi:hypothetical protein
MSEQIDQFFRPDGTLISIPLKPAKKMAVLQHIASEPKSMDAFCVKILKCEFEGKDGKTWWDYSDD